MGAKRENVLKLAGNDDEKILIGKLLDKSEQAEKYFKPMGSEFLDLRGQELCKMAMAGSGIANFALNGGFDEAERKCAVFLPEYMEVESIMAENLPFCAINIENKWKNELNHRDYLGALMGEGIRRETVGDILVYDGGADVILMRDVAEFVERNMQKVASCSVKISQIEFSRLHKPEIKVKIMRDTVASLRLDAIITIAFAMSRANAAELIKKGAVMVNGAVVNKPDFEMKQGMNISSRGHGKALLAEIIGKSKKDRQIVEVHKFI